MTAHSFTGRDGNKLAADVYGNGTDPPVVLLHGGGQTRHAWGTTAAVLAEHGWHAFSIDLRGHSDSEWAADGDYTLDAFAGDIEAIARSLPRPPVLVGASLGGIAALTAIAEAEPPNTIARGLVLVDVGPRIQPAGVERIGDFMVAHLDGFASLDEVADAIAAYNPRRPRPSNLDGLRKNVRHHDDGRWYWHWDPNFVLGKFGSPDETRSSLRNEHRLEVAAKALTVPTLCVRGRVSDLLSVEDAEAFVEMVPTAHLVDVAGAGHMVAGDRNDLFNDAVVSFLDELAGRDEPAS